MARVLIVEDIPELRELIVNEVSDMGHDVMSACDGEEALGLVATQTPQIILSDINMPKMNGYQFRKALEAKHAVLSGLPFIFVSAYSDETDIADGLIAGADHYVTKPIDFDALGALISELT
ncbi:MAG: response regulator [Pseudomonadota bacterium]